MSRAAGEIMSGKTVENGGGGRRRKTGAVNNAKVELTNTFEEGNEGEDYANNNDLANSSENNLNGIIVASEISSSASQVSKSKLLQIIKPSYLSRAHFAGFRHG